MGRQVKQIIVIREDITMPVGKIASQAAHASMGALFSLGRIYERQMIDKDLIGLFSEADHVDFCKFVINDPMKLWLQNAFTKIVLAGKNKEELIELEWKAKEMGLPVALITDNGKTCFNNIPTITALGIGPWWSDEIDKITGHLELY